MYFLSGADLKQANGKKRNVLNCDTKVPEARDTYM